MKIAAKFAPYRLLRAFPRDKQTYVRQELATLETRGSIFLFTFGIIITLALTVLDRISYPYLSFLFLKIRIVTAGLQLLFVYLLIKNLKWNIRGFTCAITMIGATAVTGMVTAMIYLSKDPTYRYDTGLILVAMFALGALPFPSIIEYYFFLLVTPIGFNVGAFFMGLPADLTQFYVSNIFIWGAAGILGIWRLYGDYAVIAKLGLEYDLQTENTTLENAVAGKADDLRRKTEELIESTRQLSSSERWFKSIFDNSEEPIAILNTDGIILNANKAMFKLHKFAETDLLGMDITVLKTPEEHREVARRIEKVLKGEKLAYETWHFTRDGAKLLLEANATAINVGDKIYIEVFYRDITEKRQIENQLMYSQKMDSIGVMAGQIAHNMNNIMTSILGFVSIMADSPNLNVDERGQLKSIEICARKAGLIGSKLLSFAKGNQEDIIVFNLHEIVTECLKLFSGLTGKTYNVISEFDDTSHTIKGQPNQVEQVIMNLLLNAKEALPMGGKIEVSVRSERLMDEILTRTSRIPPGDYAVLEIADSGIGIAEENIEKIFLPFFSTKVGNNSGLGLASVYGIVKSHGAFINVDSEVGQGTIIQIFFPSVRTGEITDVGPESQVSFAGNPNILLVDDDKSVLSMLRDLLKANELDCITCHNPLHVMDIMKQNAGHISLLVVDLYMPLMTGVQLIESIKVIDSKLKIMVLSAYPDDMDSSTVDYVMKKPFDSRRFVTIVRQLRDRQKECRGIANVDETSAAPGSLAN